MNQRTQIAVDGHVSVLHGIDDLAMAIVGGERPELTRGCFLWFRTLPNPEEVHNTLARAISDEPISHCPICDAPLGVLPEVDSDDNYADLDTFTQRAPNLDDELAADRLFEWE